MIRSRNIGFNVDRMKPRTRFYAFFDGVAVTNYITPKVIEIIKNSTTDSRTNETPFVVGETVTGQTSGCQLKVVAPDDGYKPILMVRVLKHFPPHTLPKLNI